MISLDGYVSPTTGNYNYFKIDASGVPIPDSVPLKIPGALILNAGVGAIDKTDYKETDFVIKGCEMPTPVMVPLAI